MENRTATITPAGKRSLFQGQVHYVIRDADGQLFGANGPVEKAVALQEIAKAGATLLRNIAGEAIPAEYEVSRKKGVISIRSKEHGRKAQLTQMSRNNWYVAFFIGLDAVESNAGCRENCKHAAAIRAALHFVGKGY